MKFARKSSTGARRTSGYVERGNGDLNAKFAFCRSFLVNSAVLFRVVLLDRKGGARGDALSATFSAFVFALALVDHLNRHLLLTVAAVVDEFTTLRVKIFAFLAEARDIDEVVVVRGHGISCYVTEPLYPV